MLRETKVTIGGAELTLLEDPAVPPDMLLIVGDPAVIDGRLNAVVIRNIGTSGHGPVLAYPPATGRGG